ncbi:hypothetical protein EDD37DRAFT_604112 [Exophiala viscosa]|uniref:uncharacterized protein n=1 Tax=Exophiala viscosa TaxID=2486360 RepID=UPI00219FD693|nr:hypothetical protein EDD37DRAFT_604112 [Exophiala viscosa]
MADQAGYTAPSKQSRSNVRTGCMVCKTRKVKCDESRPFCVRCTSTGRKCEGYIDPTPIQRRPLSPRYGYAAKELSTYRPSLNVSGDIRECRSFQYFQSRSMQAISSYFETDFWGYLVLQISRDEPAVHHALVALSSLYEIYEFNRGELETINTSAIGPRARFALQQYTKAVALLTPDVSGNRPSLQSVLISCILFVWIEFLHNDLDKALHHLQAGLRILDNVQRQASNTRIDPYVPRLFRRLHIMGRLHGSPTSDFNSEVYNGHISSGPDVPHTFASIFEARDSLDANLDLIFRFLRRMYSADFVALTMKHHPSPDPKSLECTVQYHLNNLSKWQTEFQRCSSLFVDSSDKRQSAGVMILELQCASVTIILKTLLESSEMVFDQYKSVFERMVSLAECLIHNSECSGPQALSFDFGVILPLFLVTLKCRYLGIRKRAIALLKQAPDREGISHRDSCVAFAEWKVQVEERGRESLPELEPLPEFARIHSERLGTAVVNGKQVSTVRFKRGPMDRAGQNEFEEEINTCLDPKMGEFL